MPIRIPALMGTIAAGLAVALLWPGAVSGGRAAGRPASLSEPGPFAAGWRQVTVQRPAGGQFPALLFYPATAQGEGTPYDGSGAPYPAISFGHGYLQPPTRYQSTLEHLATWGYFVIATKSGLELFPDHEEYAADLRWCLSYLESENSNPTSWLYHQVDTAHFGLSGHSMGAGASILATAADPRVKALANLAAAETRPSAIGAMANIRVPVSLISGSADRIVPVERNGQLMYNNGHPPKLLPLIVGGTHCGFEDVWSLGCDRGGIGREAQLEITRRLLTAFFNLYLKGDESVWSAVWGPELRQDRRVQTQADPGLAMAPVIATGEGAPGQWIEYPITFTSTLDETVTYDLLVEGNRWPTEWSQPRVTLGPGQSVALRVVVTVPVTSGSFDVATVSARSGRDGLTRQFSVTRTKRSGGDSE